jgi:anti-sigma B factor antagonist
MQVNLRHKGSITIILDIEGKVIGVDALALKDIINQQIQVADSEEEPGGKLNIILNLERVQMMDSSALGVLVTSYTTIQRNEGNIVLLNLGGNVRSLIVMAKLMTIFDCYDTEAEAIASIIQT